MSKKILMRNARNSFEAFLTAGAMEASGADVFSIAYNGQDQPFGALIPSSRYVVFAKYESPLSEEEFCNAVDAAIDAALDGKS